MSAPPDLYLPRELRPLPRRRRVLLILVIVAGLAGFAAAPFVIDRLAPGDGSTTMTLRGMTFAGAAPGPVQPDKAGTMVAERGRRRGFTDVAALVHGPDEMRPRRSLAATPIPVPDMMKGNAVLDGQLDRPGAEALAVSLRVGPLPLALAVKQLARSGK